MKQAKVPKQNDKTLGKTLSLSLIHSFTRAKANNEAQQTCKERGKHAELNTKGWER